MRYRLPYTDDHLISAAGVIISQSYDGACHDPAYGHSKRVCSLYEFICKQACQRSHEMRR